jgi:hypothetical protein
MYTWIGLQRRGVGVVLSPDLDFGDPDGATPPTEHFVRVRTCTALLSRSPVLSSMQSFMTNILSQASHRAQFIFVEDVVWRLV